MVRREQQTGAFAFEPLADGCDFVRRCLLLGKQVVEAKHHEGVGIGQNSFVYRLFEPRLVDALEHGNRMTGGLPSNLLEAERGAVE